MKIFDLIENIYVKPFAKRLKMEKVGLQMNMYLRNF